MKKNIGIALIALIITIIILLILAGITIASFGGENGLFSRVKHVKRAQIESEMKEKLNLAIQDLQVEKLAEATLDDITQEWADNKLKEYNPKITDDASINGKKITMSKDQLTGRYIIDENLNIVEQEKTVGAVLTYEVKSREGENLQVEVVITDDENGLQTIEYKDGLVQHANGLKRVSRDCTIQLGVEYKVKIVSKSGEEKTETILINDYYHKITKELGEGISIDNVAVKTAYNKPYQAIITAKDNYIVTDLLVTMDGQDITTSGSDVVDINIGKIYIDKVTGDINIIAKSKKLEIQLTEPIIGTSTTSTSSVLDNSQIAGTTLYINFSAKLEGTSCTIVNKNDNKTVPYPITTNGTYVFIITTIYQNKTITKEEKIVVNKYKILGGFVQYDAGDWTQQEIEELQNDKLYDLNENHEVNSSLKVDINTGKNLTFGGFTYKKDKNGNENPDASKKGVIISRNQSVSPEIGSGTPQLSGWRIFETTEKDGKTYVIKLIHAGSPENFVYSYAIGVNDGMAKYICYSGLEMTNYNKTSSGKILKARNWDMYKDKNQLELIDNVHCLNYEETEKVGGYNTGFGGYIVPIGSAYWIMTNGFGNGYIHFSRYSDGWITVGALNNCLGIRPVVELKTGVIIKGGDGTMENPYVLGIE